VQVGRPLPRELVLADHGIELGGSSLSIETSQCGRFEADRFGIPHRSAVFLVLSTELRRAANGMVPFEVARVEYRGDLLQLRLEVSDESPGAIEAVWALTDEADGRLAERVRVSTA
jgi:GntR family transcriptional regulator